MELRLLDIGAVRERTEVDMYRKIAVFIRQQSKRLPDNEDAEHARIFGYLLAIELEEKADRREGQGRGSPSG